MEPACLEPSGACAVGAGRRSGSVARVESAGRAPHDAGTLAGSLDASAARGRHARGFERDADLFAAAAPAPAPLGRRARPRSDVERTRARLPLLRAGGLPRLRGAEAL